MKIIYLQTAHAPHLGDGNSRSLLEHHPQGQSWRKYILTEHLSRWQPPALGQCKFPQLLWAKELQQRKGKRRVNGVCIKRTPADTTKINVWVGHKTELKGPALKLTSPSVCIHLPLCNLDLPISPNEYKYPAASLPSALPVSTAWYPSLRVPTSKLVWETTNISKWNWEQKQKIKTNNTH